jgi:hypothetical protein
VYRRKINNVRWYRQEGCVAYYEQVINNVVARTMNKLSTMLLSMFNNLYLRFFSTYNKDKCTKRIAILHSIARSSLGKLGNNLCLLWRFLWSKSVRPTSDAKALQFPGKRLQKSLPECFFTLDTDFDWIRQKNKPDLKISRTSVVMYCHIVRIASLNCQDVSWTYFANW